MVKLYSTRGLILSMIGLVGMQPLIWFLLIPFSYVSNPSLYWASYAAWVILGFISDIKATNVRKGKRIYFLFALSLLFVTGLSKADNVFYNVAYAFGGYWLGIGIGAGLFLVKPSLNVKEPERPRRSKRDISN